MTNEQTHRQETSLPEVKSSSWNIFVPENRGMLLDILIFLINLSLIPLLAPAFTKIAQQANQGQRMSQFLVFLFFALLFVLQPLGANFKRWQFHQRRRAGRRRKRSSDGFVFTFKDSIFFAVLFNPVLYFGILLLTSLLMIRFFMNEFISEKNVSDDDSLFIVYALAGFLISVVHSLAVYRYFTSPTKEPKIKAFYGPSSGTIGDALLFVNIILFQILWNIVGQIPAQSMSTLGDYMVRTFFLVCMALLIYFPSRIFYSAEDIKKPLAWFTILLANSPLIVRFIYS
jgi:hypothetical protein